MNKKKVFEKIRKMLALAESGNKHEAASALRQAKRLMSKHNLTNVSGEMFQVKSLTVSSEFTRHPVWAVGLAQVIGLAFDCSAFVGHKKVIYVGNQACVDMCGYALEILMRQIKREKKEYLQHPLFGRLSNAKKRQMGRSFCEGWIIGVSQEVWKFAQGISESDQALHTEYLRDHEGHQVREMEWKPKKVSAADGSAYAAKAGMDKGKNARLHRGVSQTQQQKLEAS